MGKRIATAGLEGLVPFHSQKEFRAHHKMEDVGLLLLVLDLGEKFDFINDFVRAVSHNIRHF